MSEACGHRRIPTGPPRPPADQPPCLRAVIELTRAEVFEACGRLALAHQSLARAGDAGAAFEVSAVLELLERRVVL